MSRPDKFDVMRAKRKPPPDVDVERRRLLNLINRLEAEFDAEIPSTAWHTEMGELRGVREIDIDAVHHTRKKKPVRTWLWTALNFNRRTNHA